MQKNVSFRCKYVLDSCEKISKFNETNYAEMVKNVIEPMASDGLRTIGLAYKDFVTSPGQDNEV